MSETEYISSMLSKVRKGLYRCGSLLRAGRAIPPRQRCAYPTLSPEKFNHVKVKRFAQRYDVHVWLVAHPRQLQDWQGKAPTLYDISGSAHFINKVRRRAVMRALEGNSGGQKVPHHFLMGLSTSPSMLFRLCPGRLRSCSTSGLGAVRR